MSILRKLRSITTPKPKKPAPMATDTNSTFVYQSGADVQKTWRKYGWTPPTEYRTDFEFGKHRDKND